MGEGLLSVCGLDQGYQAFVVTQLVLSCTQPNLREAARNNYSVLKLYFLTKLLSFKAISLLNAVIM